MKIHLVGPGGAGKTTVGAFLKDRLSTPFVDLDMVFRERAGDISDYMQRRGYQAYARYITAEACILALSSGFTLDQRAAVLDRLVADNERALELAGVRFRVGASDLRAVNQQQLALYSAKSARLHVEADRRVQRVNLHLALGGAFDMIADPQKQGRATDPRAADAPALASSALSVPGR